MSIKEDLTQFIAANCLSSAHDVSQLTDISPLIFLGILDSVNIFKVILHIEKQYGISVQIEDASRKNFATVNSIESFILSRIAPHASV